MKLDKSELYNVYFGPAFADIQKEPELFEAVGERLTANQIKQLSQARQGNERPLVVSYANYSKSDEPAAYIR